MSASVPLTHLESRVLDAIECHINEHGVAPTIAELATSLRLKSKGTVHRYVQSLIAKNRLTREGNGWRGLRMVNVHNIPANPESANPRLANISPAHLRNVQTLPAATAYLSSTQSEVTDLKIPLLGRIAAGQPIEAIEDNSYLDLAAFFVGPDRYALRVTGDSMIDAGILDGDTIIVKKQKTARTGDIVVALIDAQEATLKRLGESSDEVVELIPENSTMNVMKYAASRVSFQGVLVAQLRSY